MASKRTFYVVQIGKFYVHRYSELDREPPVMHLGGDLNEAHRFDGQSEATKVADKLFGHVHDNTEIGVHRVHFEQVHRLRRKRPRKG